MSKRIKLIIAAVTLVAVGVGYFVFASGTKKVETRYITEEVSKGTIVVSVDGTGQVEASNQIDISPKVSGEITTLNIVKGQKILAGDQIALIDSSDAQKNVRDAALNVKNAEIALEKLNETVDDNDVAKAQGELEQAKLALEELLEPLDEYDLLTEQNDLEKLERAVQKAEEDLAQVQIDSDQELEDVYADIYSAISNAYLEMPELVDHAYDVMWDSVRRESYKSSFITSLGDKSTFISDYESDYYNASQALDANFKKYKDTPRESSDEVIFKLLEETLLLAKEVSEVLESSRNLLDAQISSDNLTYFATTVVEPMLQIIQADISTINQQISNLETIKDNIDNIIQELPEKIKDAEDALEDAQRAVEEKELYLENLEKGPSEKELLNAQENIRLKEVALAELYEGADPLDIESQQLVIQERKNSLADAQSELADYVVRAPFDLVVADVLAAKGDNVNTGTGLATVITEKMVATISLNEIDISKVKVGNKATLTFDAVEDLTIAGEVAEVDLIGTANQGVVSYNVKITFQPQDERIKSGMSVSASIISESKADVLLISSAALKTEGDTYYVEVLENSPQGGSAQGVTSNVPPVQKTVEIGLSNDTSTEIISGLEEGDMVVTRTVAGTTATTPAATTGGAMGGGGPTTFGGGGFSGGAMPGGASVMGGGGFGPR
ncbi:MAG: HlyD family efflux transporter periplasmic adaptor subunit [Candidatus Altimarinota bacterium]